LVTFLLISHGILAVLLLGAVTHQALAGYKRRTETGSSFTDSVLATRGVLYSNAVVVLYVVVTILGGVIYAVYRIDIRPTLEGEHRKLILGLFELKEHFVAIGLALLPPYWYVWHAPAESAFGRRTLTVLLATLVWFGFLVGHVVNNVRGFGGL
jgi:hypothetical protein